MQTLTVVFTVGFWINFQIQNSILHSQIWIQNLNQSLNTVHHFEIISTLQHPPGVAQNNNWILDQICIKISYPCLSYNEYCKKYRKLKWLKKNWNTFFFTKLTRDHLFRVGWGLRNSNTHCFGLISIIEIPVTVSPYKIVCSIGDAPRHRGNRLGWTFNIPLKQQVQHQFKQITTKQQNRPISQVVSLFF